jgi:hypothetical protein
MATGLIALTCLLLAAATPDDVVYMNQRGFQIPVSLRSDGKAKELILYMSRDEGKSWEIHNRATPDTKVFNFLSPNDGMIYFIVGVVNQAGQVDPPDIYKAPIGLRIYIDTTKPTVHITAAERVADEIHVSWEARDEKPERASLRLEWRMASGSQWTPLPIEPGGPGIIKFRPGVVGDVVLKLSMRDLAGNLGSEEKQVGSSTMTSSLDRGMPNGVNNGGLIPASGQDLVPPPPLPTPGPAPLPQGQPLTMRPTEPAPGMAPYSPMPTRGSLPPIQIVNKKSLKLGFDVSKVGPSGLGSVDVYVTTDEGATWQKSTADPSVSLPVSAEIRGVGLQKGTVTVQLPNDGVVYGFYLVVKSRAGLGKPGPKSGDAPQLRIEVDTTQPLAELYQPQPDASRVNALLLTWKAEDRNLAANPVSLEWSESGRDWHSIGDTMLPNTGRFTWQVPANIPPKVLLRLTVRDTAGNQAVAKTDNPVLIDLTEPEVGQVSIVVP